jgi:hypothetical protein
VKLFAYITASVAALVPFQAYAGGFDPFQDIGQGVDDLLQAVLGLL